jgi:hypothetical protein
LLSITPQITKIINKSGTFDILRSKIRDAQALSNLFMATTINRNKQMRTNISKKIRFLALLSLPFIITASAFAQSLPTVSVNPNQIDFGDIPVGSTLADPHPSSPVTVEVTNTSEEDLRLTPTLAQRNPRFTVSVLRSVDNPNDLDLIKTGRKGRFLVYCNPVIVGDIINAAIHDSVNIKVKHNGQLVKQLKCTRNLASSCDLQAVQGVDIEVKSENLNFISFINPTGSANCNKPKVCAFKLIQDSAVTATFNQPSLPPSPNK